MEKVTKQQATGYLEHRGLNPTNCTNAGIDVRFNSARTGLVLTLGIKDSDALYVIKEDVLLKQILSMCTACHGPVVMNTTTVDFPNSPYVYTLECEGYILDSEGHYSKVGLAQRKVHTTEMSEKKYLSKLGIDRDAFKRAGFIVGTKEGDVYTLEIPTSGGLNKTNSKEVGIKHIKDALAMVRYFTGLTKVQVSGQVPAYSKPTLMQYIPKGQTQPRWWIVLNDRVLGKMGVYHTLDTHRS